MRRLWQSIAYSRGGVSNIYEMPCNFRRRGRRFLEPGVIALNYEQGLYPILYAAGGNE